MKASDLKPGDVIRRCPSELGLEGWTVHGLNRHGSHEFLSLERPVTSLVGFPGRLEQVRSETRTAWLAADAEVGCE